MSGNGPGWMLAAGVLLIGVAVLVIGVALTRGKGGDGDE